MNRFLPRRKRRPFIPRNYKIFSDVGSHTLKECMIADRYNDELYSKRLKRFKQAREKLQREGVDIGCSTPVSPPPESNMRNFHLVRQRHLLMPAVLQSEATLGLHSMGFKLFVDYEPCDAIATYKQLKKQENEVKDISNLVVEATRLEPLGLTEPQPGMPQPQPGMPQPEIPQPDMPPSAPPAYPNLKEIGGYPPGYSHVDL